MLSFILSHSNSELMSHGVILTARNSVFPVGYLPIPCVKLCLMWQQLLVLPSKIGTKAWCLVSCVSAVIESKKCLNLMCKAAVRKQNVWVYVCVCLGCNWRWLWEVPAVLYAYCSRKCLGFSTLLLFYCPQVSGDGFCGVDCMLSTSFLFHNILNEILSVYLCDCPNCPGTALKYLQQSI